MFQHPRTLPPPPCRRNVVRRLESLALLVFTLAAPWLALADQAGANGRADLVAAGLGTGLAAPEWSPPRGSVNFHSTSFVPITEMPTEDVDVTMATTTNPLYPEMGIWPVEGRIHFFDLAGGPPALIASLPTLTAHVTGVDFVTDGTWGAFMSLGRGYLFSMSGGPGSTPSLLATTLLSGALPNRRDIDPLIIPDPLSPAGVSAVFTDGNNVRCRAFPTGAVRWDIILPGPIVEAVDPSYSPNGKLFVPTEGTLVVIDPVAGSVLSSTPLGGSLVREVDVRYSGAPSGPGPSYAWLPVSGTLWVFDDAPGSLGASVASLPLASPLIEGNDMEIDPTGTLAYLPTLAFMYQVNLPAAAFGATYPVGTMTHVRNHDTVFTPLGVVPAKWAYAMQGFMLIGDNFLFAPPPAVLLSPGVTVDGVDPSFSDTPPFGTIVSIATLAATNVYQATTISMLASIPRSAGAGVLRVDVDHKPGPMAGNYVIQPTIGGLLSISGFGPDEWVVTTSTGIEVVDLAALSVVEYIPFAIVGAGMAYRGGDGQPTFMAAAGPLEPGFSVDNPDQDFLTKCYEYKYATRQNPYLYAQDIAAFYPHYLPYGAFGPPALAGWDFLNRVKVIALEGNLLGVIGPDGNLLHTLAVPQMLGGLVWDWDNKICKVRVAGQQEAIVDLSPMARGLPPTVNLVAFSAYTRWYPVVDRMNGWECVIERDGVTLAVYDHLKRILVQKFILPAKVIRAPEFDEQRKTLVVPLANRTVAFFNAHNYRVGLPPAQYLYYSPVLADLVVHRPVFDLYHHLTLLTLRDNRIVALSNATGAILYDSGVILNRRLLSPIQVDCYNSVAKGFVQNTVTLAYEEFRLLLYPLALGGLPSLSFVIVPGEPYGWPQFYSRSAYDVSRYGTNTLRLRPLVLGPLFTLNTPLPMVGSPQIDRVNGYALCALQGPNLYYVNLFKQTRGLAGATSVIALPGVGNATDNIVFSTYTHQAMGTLDDGTIYVVDLLNGTAWTDPGFATVPPGRPNLYVNPYEGLINTPRWDPPATNVDVTFNLVPTRADPALAPGIYVTTLPGMGGGACDTIPPPPPPPANLIAPQPSDDFNVHHFRVGPVEPGCDVFVYKPGASDFAPTYGTADEDGVCEDISVVGVDGETVCFVAIDASGNAAPPMCQVITTVDVPAGPRPAALAFALTSRQPALAVASFSLALPEAGRVRITAYDVSGRRVRAIVDRTLGAGTHAVEWDLRGEDGALRAGVFFVRAQTPSGEMTERVVVAN